VPREFVPSSGSAMNGFDLWIVSFLNSFAHRSHAFDVFVAVVLQTDLIKAGVITALLWWAWFQPTCKREQERHEFLVSWAFASFLSLVTARILALSLPFRERPLHNPGLHLQVPYGLDENTLINWSSFPSDHAALFCALATTIFFVSRRLGVLAFLHVFFVMCLARIYLGFHYPTDILAGAAIGIAAAYLTKIAAFRTAVARPPLRWASSHPPSFYATFFLVTFLIATVFDPVRHLGHMLLKAAKVSLKFP
jgi:undecaprenyl-diphosphatase